MDKSRVLLAFLFALAPTLTIPVVLPQLSLIFFAPFLCLMCYKRPLHTCLWFALGCGLIIDLLAPGLHLGTHAANYLLSTLAVYQLRSRFFEDRPTTLPVMTYLFALVSTFLQVLLLKGMGVPYTLSGLWWLTDVLLLPIADALCALVWFALPAYLLRRRPNMRDNTFSLARYK